MDSTSTDLARRFDPPLPFAGVLAPNEERQLDYPGVYCRVQEANGPLKISFDLGQFFSTAVGLGYQTLPGEQFSRVTLRNDSASPVTFLVIVGRMRLDDSRLNILVGSSYLPMTEPNAELIGANITNLAAGATLVLSGAVAAGQYKRSCVIVDNLDAAAVLTIYDAADRVSGYVLPSQSKALYLSGVVKVKNETVGAINCGVAEVFELNP